MSTTFISKNCTACAKERKRKNFVYDPVTLAPYCNSAYMCNEDHPNSAPNLIKRARIGGETVEVELVDYETANRAYKKLLSMQYDTVQVDKIRKLLGSPTLFRILDDKMAQFLVEFQAEQGFPDMSATVRHCIELIMESKGVFLKDHKELKEAEVKAAQVEQTVKEIESEPAQVTKPSKPKKAAADDDFTF